MNYKRLEDVNQDLQSLREKGRQKGYTVGWDWDVLPYTVILGSTTYMAAAPATGKTELILEIMINLSCLHGLNHVIYTPETGSPTDIFAELCHKYIGKPYEKSQYQMTESERTQAEYFIGEHFVIVDPQDEDLTAMQFYKLIDDIENETGKRIHCTLLDPWNELKEDFKPEDLGREDKYLSRTLGAVRKNARQTFRHHFILTHVRDQGLITQGGISYYPPPQARDFAGGQTWFRKGNTMLVPWRPPFGLSDGSNRAYGEFETLLKIAKTKPKGTSKNGSYVLNLDTQRYQYYVIDDYGKRVYADRGKHNFSHEVKPKQLTVNNDFLNETEAPF